MLCNKGVLFYKSFQIESIQNHRCLRIINEENSMFVMINIYAQFVCVFDTLHVFLKYIKCDVVKSY